MSLFLFPGILSDLHDLETRFRLLGDLAVLPYKPHLFAGFLIPAEALPAAVLHLGHAVADRIQKPLFLCRQIKSPASCVRSLDDAVHALGLRDIDDAHIRSEFRIRQILRLLQGSVIEIRTWLSEEFSRIQNKALILRKLQRAGCLEFLHKMIGSGQRRRLHIRDGDIAQHGDHFLAVLGGQPVIQLPFRGIGRRILPDGRIKSIDIGITLIPDGIAVRRHTVHGHKPQSRRILHIPRIVIHRVSQRTVLIVIGCHLLQKTFHLRLYIIEGGRAHGQALHDQFFHQVLASGILRPLERLNVHILSADL